LPVSVVEIRMNPQPLIDRLHQKAAELVALAMVPVLAGCYPVRVMQQPALDFQIQDPSGKPITDATVHLARHPDSGRSFAGGAPSESAAQTDQNGRVRFSSMHDWQVEILLPDAYATHYLWSWCIDKIGYLPSVQNRVVKSDVPSRAIVIRLEQAAENSTCSPASRNGFQTRPDGARKE
jgi:hypothetical protein